MKMNRKIVIYTNTRDVIRARMADAILAAIARQNASNGEPPKISLAVNSAVDVLLSEFRMVRR